MNRPLVRHLVSRRLAVAAAALTLGIGSVALAQPIGPGAGDPGDMVARMLQHAKARLNLDSSQQVAWGNAVAASKAAHDVIRANRQRVHDALQAELAKPQPDLGAVAALADDIAQQNRTQHINARNQWLTLYGALSPDQKTIVRDGIAQRLARLDAFRARMRERFHGPNG
ncbi:MAG TPA: periplasmic heavy metal sensor [Casimicrobiaceae bacterium]|nr:periplasmic heavy metal sensor [Casimicrobiaceae bacterium]